jgi:hypothetical protein
VRTCAPLRALLLPHKICVGVREGSRTLPRCRHVPPNLPSCACLFAPHVAKSHAPQPRLACACNHPALEQALASATEARALAFADAWVAYATEQLQAQGADFDATIHFLPGAGPGLRISFARYFGGMGPIYTHAWWQILVFVREARRDTPRTSMHTVSRSHAPPTRSRRRR